MEFLNKDETDVAYVGKNLRTSLYKAFLPSDMVANVRFTCLGILKESVFFIIISPLFKQNGAKAPSFMQPLFLLVEVVV